MSTTATHSAQSSRTHFLVKAGAGVVAIAILWWLIFYGQADGWFAQLGAKVPCLVVDTAGCGELRQEIGHSQAPVYFPLLMWAGLAQIAFGYYLTRRGKA